MIIRKPALDFEQAPIIWSQIPEFSLINNGASAMIPFVEHYLNTVIHEIRGKYGDADPVLRDELDAFIRQEGNHAKYHHVFNKNLYDAGYSELKTLAATMVAELKGFREQRSLAFNISYCAGFETVAMFSCKYTYGRCADLFEGADPGGSNLFLWHLAEEFEHRSVCHDAYIAASGNYFMRAWGLLYSFWHIAKWFNAAGAVLLEAYRKDMTPAERAQSIRREKAIKRRQGWYTVPRILLLLRPGYRPGRYSTPPRVQAALDYFNSGQAITERFDFAAA